MKFKFGLTILSLTSLLIVGCESKKTNAHIHEYSEDYSYDSKGHYNVCTYDGCENRTVYKPHEYSSTGKCVICGYYDSSKNTNIHYDENYVGTNDGHYKIDSKGNRLSKMEAHELIDTAGDKTHVPVAATCSLPGRGYKKCTVCGRFVDYTIPKLDHDYQPSSDPDRAATCTKPGEVECTMCHKIKEAPPIGHQISEMNTGINGVKIAKCYACGLSNCGVVLYVSGASGWNQPSIAMDGRSSPNNKSTWNVSGILEDGYYNIEIEAILDVASYSDRKWYNMAKANLCVNNTVEETATSNPDTTSQDDYRYYFKVNDSVIINPTVKETWGELGFGGDYSSPYRYGFICKGVAISGADTFSLCHGNIDYPLIINSVKLTTSN